VLESSDLIAFVSTAEPERSRLFYETTLGLRVIDDSTYACAYDVHGTQLRVTVVDDVSPRPYTVLGWRVDDIDAAVRALTARDVTVVRYPGMDQDEAGVWTSPSGARIAWFEDPDHNLLSLTEF
jgi:catechol 2,3-dioxygenase-like lactoylglutathione lyase family enzyme